MKNDKGQSPGICFNVDTPDVLAKRGQFLSLVYKRENQHYRSYNQYLKQGFNFLYLKINLLISYEYKRILYQLFADNHFAKN
jgi:hypothetical protein